MKGEHSREQEFIDRIYEHQGILRRISSLYGRTREDGEDCYQDILLQLWRSFSSFRGESKFSTWMYRVALNTALINKRSLARRRDAVSESGQTPDLTVPFEGVDEDVALLYRCISELPELDRAITLLYLEQQSYEEIASVTGLSKSNVSVRIVRIKKRLHDLLVAEGYQEE